MYFLLWYSTVILQASVAPPEVAYIWTKLAEQGIIVVLMGVVIIYLKNRLDKKEVEIKTLYELQSKEYLASLNIMAAASDSNNKLKALLDEQPESLKAILKNQKESRDILENMNEQFNRLRDGRHS